MGSSTPDDAKRRREKNGETAHSPSGPTLKSGRCPICGAPSEAHFRPFCSHRCSDVDLSRWLRGAYAIPGRADVDEDGDDTIAASSAGQPIRPPDDDAEDDGRR